MSIGINSNLQGTSHYPVAKKAKTGTGTFSIPTNNEDEENAVDLSGIFRSDWRSVIQQLPDGIGMNDAQLIAKIEERTANIVFDFGDDGSVTIRQGLSRYDLARAQAALRELELWRQGH